MIPIISLVDMELEGVTGGVFLGGGGGMYGVGSGGGGGAQDTSPTTSGAGGSGVVILRVPTANYSGTTSGSPTVTTVGTEKVIVFNADGSYTA